MRSKLLLALTLSALLGANGAARAAERALGAGGDLYRVATGRYGDLFPGGAAAKPADQVLALEVLRAGATAPVRYLVPTTGDRDAESGATLVFENATDTVYVLWQNLASEVFPVLNLASFQGGSWSAVIPLAGNPFAHKSAIQFFAVRDVFALDGASGLEARSRTVLHLVWAEEDGVGDYHAFYTPAIFEDGVYLAHHSVHELRAFDRLESSAEVAPALLKAPRLQPGSDGRSAIVAFADGVSGRVAAVEIRALPRDLTALGDRARAHIIGAGSASFPNDLGGLAGAARAHIVGASARLQPQVLRSLADELRDFILAWRPENGDLIALGDAARAHIIGAGSGFAGDGMVPVAAEGAQAAVREEIRSGEPAGPAHLFSFRVASSRPAPRIGGAAQTAALFSSPDGTAVTVAWALADRVRYRESGPDGWSDVREIRFTPEVNLDAAWKILADRARGR